MWDGLSKELKEEYAIALKRRQLAAKFLKYVVDEKNKKKKIEKVGIFERKNRLLELVNEDLDEGNRLKNTVELDEFLKTLPEDKIKSYNSQLNKERKEHYALTKSLSSGRNRRRISNVEMVGKLYKKEINEKCSGNKEMNFMQKSKQYLENMDDEEKEVFEKIRKGVEIDEKNKKLQLSEDQVYKTNILDDLYKKERKLMSII